MLSTERLLLREWRETDREPLAAINADPEVMRFLGPPMTRERSDAFVDRAQRGFRRHPGWGWFAVQERATGELLGTVGLEHVHFEAHFTPAVEVGWQLARTAWGRGLATEAASALVALAFDELELEQVVAFTLPANAASLGVMRRLGMTHDPADDFDHPELPDGPLRRHVLLRLRRP